MSFTIPNLTERLVLSFSTNSTIINYRLKVFLDNNHTSTPDATYTGTGDGEVIKYYIPFDDFRVGDVIDRLEMELNGTTDIKDTHEGITFLLDGEEAVTNHTGSFTTSFDDGGEHTIQAVYKGNNLTSMAYTTLLPFQITQPVVAEGDDPVNDRVDISFVNKNLKTMKYNDNTLVQLKVTKGGKPLSGEYLEVITPRTGEPSTMQSNSQGIVQWRNTGFNAGTWIVGAYFHNSSQQLVKKCLKEITIKKLDTNLSSASGSSLLVGNKMEIALKDEKGNALANKKITLYVNSNSNKYVATTNNQGKISFRLKQLGAFSVKAVFNGDTNYNKSEVTLRRTVVNS